MSGMIVAGFVIVIALLMTLARFDLLKFLGYSSAVDILFTVLMFTMFHDTYSGIVASAFAGVFMTTMLYLLRGILGCKKLRIVVEGRMPRLRWVYMQPQQYRGSWFKGHAA